LSESQIREITQMAQIVGCGNHGLRDFMDISGVKRKKWRGTNLPDGRQARRRSILPETMGTGSWERGRVGELRHDKENLASLP
jgi:hypothetical protein